MNTVSHGGLGIYHSIKTNNVTTGNMVRNIHTSDSNRMDTSKIPLTVIIL